MWRTESNFCDTSPVGERAKAQVFARGECAAGSVNGFLNVCLAGLTFITNQNRLLKQERNFVWAFCRGAPWCSRTRKHRASAWVSIPQTNAGGRMNLLANIPPLQSLIDYIEIILSVLFGTAGAKRTKNAEIFRACGRDSGLCPKTPPPFEKGGRKLS